MTPKFHRDDQLAVTELIGLLAEARRWRQRPTDKPNPAAWQQAQAVTVRLARFLASLLVGLSAHHVLELVQIFLREFLGRLTAANGLGEAEVLTLAGLPLDMVLDKRLAGRKGGEA